MDLTEPHVHKGACPAHLIWAAQAQVSHPATSKDISHRGTARVFTDVVVKVSVVMEEGEGSMATGHVIAPSASAPPVVSMKNYTVLGKKNPKTQQK